MNDLKLAFRQLRKSPGFTVVAVLTLALGIGANTALFSAFNTFVLHPLTFPQADRLLRLWVRNPASNYNIPYVSWPRYEFIRDHQKSFSNISAAGFASYALTPNGADPEQLNALQVTTSFFPTLGIMPLRGRNFTKQEDSIGGANVAILSYECWQRYFGGRDSAIGETIILSGASYTIIGVLPPRFGQPFNTVMVFVPRVFEPQDIATEQVQNGAGFLNVTARLKDGVTFEQAAAEMRMLAENYKAAFSEHVDGNYDSVTKTFVEELVGNFRSTFHLLLAAVGFVLLIACANVASLFLGRLSTRRKEIAVRLALGATRGRLLRQFLAESIVFSAAAGLLGVLLGCWSLDLIQQIVAGAVGKSGVAGILGTNPLPESTPLGLDGATLAFTIAVSVLSALLVGCVPALETSRAGAVAEVLKDTARSAAGGARGVRFRSGLIVGEVALSVVLLVGSALLLVSLVHLQRTQPGFEPRGVATAFINITGPRYATESQQADFFAQLTARLETLPQVKSAAVGYDVPLTGFQASTTYTIAGHPMLPLAERARSWLDRVSEHYFAAMGIPLREGRMFNERDNEHAPNVCIINQSFAKRLFPDESALGKILLRGPDAEIKCQIVGVVADVKSANLNEPAPDEIYVPFHQVPQSVGTLIVRTDGDPATLQAAIRSKLASLDNTVALAFFTTMDTALSSSLIFPRITVWLTGAFASVALLLSAVGLYSVLAYAVTQRTNEIGLRMALGAQRQQVVTLVLRSGLTLVALGLVIGLAISAGTARLIQTLLFSVRPIDPLIYGGVTVFFAFIAILACLLPSVRASRIDPMIALRTE
jgi:predicted permease